MEAKAGQVEGNWKRKITTLTLRGIEAIQQFNYVPALKTDNSRPEQFYFDSFVILVI
jgi:hypothetical protein